MGSPQFPTSSGSALSPDMFSDGKGSVAATSGSVTTLSITDRQTLASALGLLRSTRADVGSLDEGKAAKAKASLAALVSYLLGFCDSRGWLIEAPVAPGLEALFGGRAQPSLDLALTDLENGLAAILGEEETRSVKRVVGTIVSALGDAAIAIGAALLVVPFV